MQIDVLKTVQKSDPVGKFNCIKMETWFDYRGHICMVFEKCGLSLFDFLRKNHYKPFSSHLVQNYGRQLLRAVSFLHTLNLVHTDLKPENILLLSSAYQRVPVSSGSKFTKRVPMGSTIRLIDFGSATFENQYHSTVVSTRHYRAPEVILGMGWSYPCDVWSVGCILVELLTGDALFQTHENLEHLAMMEVVLGPIQPRVMQRADRHAQKYFRGGNELNWPEGSQSRESIRAVRKMERLQDIVRTRLDGVMARNFTDLLFSKFPLSVLSFCVASTRVCVFSLSLWVVFPWFRLLRRALFLSPSSLPTNTELLEFAPEDRITPADALKHAFFDMDLASEENAVPTAAHPTSPRADQSRSAHSDQLQRAAGVSIAAVAPGVS
jgi:dual-specificity kinase